MPYNNLRSLVAGCLFLGGIPLWAAGAGLLNLAEKPTAPRFKLTDKEWPSKPGEASICLWNDDKLAAFSLTIDDNCAMDVPWWLEQSKKLHLPITWFLISGGVENPKSYQGMTGNWALWKSVVEQGEAVESHTVTHLHVEGKDAAGKPKFPEGWKGVEWEYAESIKQIEAGIPGYKVHFLAFPGGGGGEMNDRNLAAKYYLANRTGRGLNPANQIDYMWIKCVSKPTELDAYFDPKSKAYRGWANAMTHYVGNETLRAHAVEILDFYKNHASDLWGGLFGDVARYGQERDTAKLVVDENSSAQIAFTLTDQMNDEFYDYPLTIKVRLPGDWKAVKAVQQEKELPVTIVEKDGGKFALVKAVPDKGKVVMTAKP